MSTFPGAASEVSLVIEVACDHCGRKPGVGSSVFIEMARWLGDKPTEEERVRPPWFLCVPCWFEGLHPNKVQPMRIVEPVAGPVVLAAPAPEMQRRSPSGDATKSGAGQV